ncbi:hypothetical protein GDO78_010173 [Eleutherodactylus coqui]|uniref:Uncharacterized protein n=1 Tax=Eleutherodactylus coqui TaxID=57060 RepID=A0A8J6F563_ELECQ|nr:hypothetical protein GDO78_010173 [Eleutherodactylus coqui]
MYVPGMTRLINLFLFIYTPHYLFAVLCTFFVLQRNIQKHDKKFFQQDLGAGLQAQLAGTQVLPPFCHQEPRFFCRYMFDDLEMKKSVHTVTMFYVFRTDTDYLWFLKKVEGFN